MIRTTAHITYGSFDVAPRAYVMHGDGGGEEGEGGEQEVMPAAACPGNLESMGGIPGQILLMESAAAARRRDHNHQANYQPHHRLDTTIIV